MNCSGIRTQSTGVALRFKNAKGVTRDGNYLMFRLDIDHARELVELLKMLIPDHGQVMPTGTYYPLLGCDKCQRLTRHHFLRAENRIFKTSCEPTDLTDQERNNREHMNAMLLYLYGCGTCGTERGWGSSGV
jgi:hypothetical protein